MKYHYTIEMYKNGQWVVEDRYYECEKSLTDFDLCDVEGKRRNAKFIGTTKY